MAKIGEVQDADERLRSCTSSLKHMKLLPDWPGNSPDLSPIEDLWSHIIRRKPPKQDGTPPPILFIENLYELIDAWEL